MFLVMHKDDVVRTWLNENGLDADPSKMEHQE